MLMGMLRLVVVAELDVVRVTVCKAEADVPLVVHGDGVLPCAIAFDGVEAIAGGHFEIGDLLRDVRDFELAQGATRHVGGHLLGFPCTEALSSLPVGKDLDQAGMQRVT